MKARAMIACVAGALAAVAVAVVLAVPHLSGESAHHASSVRPAGADGAVPPGAVSTARMLVSASGRETLTPELSSVLPPGRLFPPGTTFTVDPGSWLQSGAYAKVTGTLRVPGKKAEQAEIGLVRRGGRWLVTFEAAR
jgi:hypothetical protein